MAKGCALAYRQLTLAGDVDEEILDLAKMVYEGFYDGKKIDWDDFLDRMDGSTLANGDVLDLGDSMLSPAVIKIKTHVRQLEKQD